MYAFLFNWLFPIGHSLNMVGVAQLVRASDCGSEGRGFESRHSPQIFFMAILSKILLRVYVVRLN